jgi:dihydroorotase
MLNRREFSRYFLAGGAAMLAPGAVWPAASSAAPPQQNSSQTIDLLIEGGTVIDPGQNLHAPLDVAVKDGKILEVSKNIPKERALKVVSAKDRIVTPGFIDVHAHCFEGVSFGINADRYCLSRGVTTVVDAGSAGYSTINNLHKFIVNTSTTRIHALINIGVVGTAMLPGSLMNLDWVNPQLTAKAATDNKPVVVGIKVHLGKAITGAGDMECLKRALAAAEIARVPLMAHIEDSYSPLPDILKMLRKGDIYTHCFNSRPHNILDANGKIIPEALEARVRGVLFDPAQGQTHLNFDIVEKCLQQNFPPDTISTDLTSVAVERRIYDLPTMVSKFMALGVDIDKAIGMVTSDAARMFDYGAQLGTLRPGSEADIGIFDLRDGKFEFEDSDGGKRTGRQMLVNKTVVRRGQVFINAI